MFSLLCLFYLPEMVCSGPGYQVILVAVARGQMAYVYGFGFDGDDDSHVSCGNRVISITLKPAFYEAEFPFMPKLGVAYLITRSMFMVPMVLRSICGRFSSVRSISGLLPNWRALYRSSGFPMGPVC